MKCQRTVNRNGCIVSGPEVGGGQKMYFTLTSFIVGSVKLKFKSFHMLLHGASKFFIFLLLLNATLMVNKRKIMGTSAISLEIIKLIILSFCYTVHGLFTNIYYQQQCSRIENCEKDPRKTMQDLPYIDSV